MNNTIKKILSHFFIGGKGKSKNLRLPRSIDEMLTANLAAGQLVYSWPDVAA